MTVTTRCVSVRSEPQKHPNREAAVRSSDRGGSRSLGFIKDGPMRPYRIYLYLERIATQPVSSGVLLPVRLCLKIFGSSSQGLIRRSARIRSSLAPVPCRFTPAPSVRSCPASSRATLRNLAERIGAHKHPCGSRRLPSVYLSRIPTDRSRSTADRISRSL